MRIEARNIEGSCIECGARDTDEAMIKIVFERKVGQSANITHPVSM